MGDKRRFDQFAKLVYKAFPQIVNWSVADVAGGKGYLRGALRDLGVKNVETWDIRHQQSKNNPGERWGLFKYDKAPKYDLVLGMHPDGATDHIVLHAARHKVPFVVCPCCVKPSATAYFGPYKYGAWLQHIKSLGVSNGFYVDECILPISGCNRVLIGTPSAFGASKK